MIPKFKIYKNGTTENPITIYQKVGEEFNETVKREMYIFLGYTIIEL